MSLLRALDGTTCSTKVPHATTRPLLSFLCPGAPPTQSQHTRRSFSQRPMKRPPRVPSPTSDPNALDALFVQALARAGSCREHQRQMVTLRHITAPNAAGGHHGTRRKSTVHRGRQQYHQSARLKGPLTKRIRQFAEKELRALVDYYGIDLESAPEETPRDDSGLLMWNMGDDHQPWPLKHVSHGTYIQHLKKMLQNEDSPHDALFSCYKRLPAPGVAYLTTETIRHLLHHLSVVERPTPEAMNRFLSILDDMKDAQIHIIGAEWTSAIRFAGLYLGTATPESLQSALHIWRDMEKRAGVKGGTVTMNVLFYVAVRAGRYSLAEVILKEMQARKLKMHRHFRISMLYYYGVMQNGNGVRRTYQAMVSAGDIVDTVVMNAVISALFRAGEPTAAEQVFERMKRLQAGKSNQQPQAQNWREKRLLGLKMTHESRRRSALGDKELLKELQEQAPIAPDSWTYGLVIRHHATTAGNIDRVQELLREMTRSNVRIDGNICIVVMRGFVAFGGVRYSSWTIDKLEKVWSMYLKAVQDGVERTFFSPRAVIAALRAFKKTADAERVLRAWEEVRKLWDPSVDESEMVMAELRRLVPEHKFFSRNV